MPTEVPDATAKPEPTEVVEEPVILRVGLLTDVDCWNPWICGGFFIFQFLTHDGLSDFGPVPGCQGVPGLSKSFELSDDGRTYTVQLHEDASFHDGEPLDANAVAAYFDWILGTDFRYWFPEMIFVESYEALDDLTFQYTTSEPFVDSPDDFWGWMPILPPHLWGEFDDSAAMAFDDYPPLGSGPYMVTEHEPGNYIILDAYEDYYLGKPPIDRVVLQIYANEEALASALRAGEIDVTTRELSVEYYDSFLAEENITVLEQNPGTTVNLIFNMHVGGVRHPALADPAVREAIDYAIDKQYMVDVHLLGHGMVCPSNWACGPNYAGEINPNLVATPFDLEMANQILDEAGYLDVDDDGIRDTPDGKPMVFRMLTHAETPAQMAIAETLDGWFGEIGLDIEIEAMEYGTWLVTVLQERDFDMTIDYEAGEVDPGSFDFRYSCWSADAGLSGFNVPGICSEEMDNLVWAYMMIPDEAERAEASFAAQEILSGSRAFITLAGQNSLQAYRSDRFEFPSDVCDVHFGLYSPYGLLNAVVK
jgi:peptide/nickel transport system substrate-binding protein